MRIGLAVLLLCFLPILLNGQGAMGMKFDSYNASETIHLNPALAHDTETKIELSLGGLHAFGYTDYGLIRRTSIMHARQIDTMTISYELEDIPTRPRIPTLIFDRNGGDKIISLGYELAGPSILLQITPDLKVGAFTKMRGALSSFDIPENYGGYELSDSEETQIIESDISSITMMMWKEAGLHISKRMGNFVLGVNARYIIPTAAGIGRLNTVESLDYINKRVQVPSQVELAYTQDIEDYTSLNDVWSAPNNGNGYGMDIGLSYMTFAFSLSASITDIGMVRNIVNTKHFYIYQSQEEYTSININEYERLDDFDDFLNQADQDLPLIKSQNEGMMMYLPTAFSLQAHIRVIPKLNISAAWIQRIPNVIGNVGQNVNSLYKNNSISVIPRYETKWFSAALPISIQEYERVHVGASLRFGYLTLGSDKVTSLVGKSDFNGTDFYAKVTLFPFWKPGLKKKKVKKKKVRKESESNKNVKCYNF